MASAKNYNVQQVSGTKSTYAGVIPGYGLSQWLTTLQCNVVCHWLNPYPSGYGLSQWLTTLQRNIFCHWLNPSQNYPCSVPCVIQILLSRPNDSPDPNKFLLKYQMNIPVFKSAIWHIAAKAKWPVFCRRYFQRHFLEWKCLNCRWYFTEVYSWGSNWQ